MNGAESLVRTLVASGVEVCFANPGTSEMHFVAALDSVPGMRCVLGLFEGVVSGAADGYYRMADQPAATLLHLGPGLANASANLHNAKKAGSGIVNIVGEHAIEHLQYDAPLSADVEGIAQPMSHWVHTSHSPATVAGDGAMAVAQARGAPGRIATLILPADTAWGAAPGPAAALPVAARRAVAQHAVDTSAKALLSGRRSALLLGGIAAREGALLLAGRIAAKTGCTLLLENNVPRLQRGAGRVRTQRIPYVVDAALAKLKDLQDVVLVGSKVPVAFFAYPGKPSLLLPPACAVTRLAAVEEDIVGALEALADALGARQLAPAHVAALERPALPRGPITAEGIATVLGTLLPEDAIVVDESISVGRNFGPATASAPPHDWLNLMGGSIGFGPPAAAGAALAAPGRPVILLEGDGSAMYTLQALWTMAREGLNVKVLILANRSYQILRGEFASVGAGQPGKRATDMLNIDRPALDWVALAQGHGVPAQSVADLETLATAFRRALAGPGPCLIELVLQAPSAS
jgi:acetolactate synthase I/II/III large subunit